MNVSALERGTPARQDKSKRNEEIFQTRKHTAENAVEVLVENPVGLARHRDAIVGVRGAVRDT